MAKKTDKDGNVLIDSGNYNQECRISHLYYIHNNDYHNYWVSSEDSHEQRMQSRVKRERIIDAVIEFVGTFTCTERDMKQIKKDFIKENILDKGLEIRWGKKQKPAVTQEEENEE